MLLVPVQALASQVLQVNLNGQVCTLAVYAKGINGSKLYMDLSVNGVTILSCAICQNRVLMVRLKYLGFVGDLAWVDMQGSNDPVWNGLGTRYQLIYLAPSDYTEPM